MSDYPETTYYTVHKNMIRKGAFKRMIADSRTDSLREEIIETIESGKPISIMDFYKRFSLNYASFDRAIKRWGLDLKEVRKKLEQNRSGKIQADRDKRIADFSENIPGIVERLSGENPDSIRNICKEFGVTSKFLHSAIKANGYDNVKLGKNAYNKIIRNEKREKAQKVKDIKKTPLGMKW